MLSSGYISLQEWILLLFSPPLSLQNKELFVLWTNQPLMGKKPSRWPISSNLLKGLTFATISVYKLSYVHSRLFLFFQEFNSAQVALLFVYIDKRKTNRLREGRSVVITETRSSTCPCALHTMYMSKAQIAVDCDEYIYFSSYLVFRKS